LQLGFSRLKLVPVVAAALLAFATTTAAGDLPFQFSGNLLGLVVDSLGTPQMGASVVLFDRYDRLVRRTLTGADGRFGFPGLAPSVYAVKISAPSLIPASRDKIAIRAGLSSVLQIRLAAIFSSVELEYTKPTAAMSDDWKWVLRASSATRVITRGLPKVAQGKSSSSENPEKIFTGTRGLLSLSAGDAGALLSESSLADFGTSFALATTMYGRTQLILSGVFGQNLNTGMPSMGVRATYSRSDTDGVSNMPEITVMAQQFYLPNHLFNYPGGSAAVRSISINYYDTVDFSGNLHLEYGSSFEAVSYFDSLNRASPFARLTTSMGRAGSLTMTYSNGGNPNDLYIHQYGDDTDLAGALGALSSLPSFSLRDNRLELERTQNYEAGYSKVAGRRTYAVSAFYENVSDGRLNVAGDLSGLNAANLLPDISTTTTLVNIGRYNRNGVMASVDQKINDSLEFGFAAGAMGGFTPGGQPVGLPGFLERADHPVASLNIRATVPRLCTRITGEYEYAADGALVPEHIFSTQRLYAEPGLNLIVHQPLPSFLGMRRLELSADLRNMLAQGYLPMTALDGNRSMLLQAPRTVRGGLNIIF
jgi:Carboxypeptidase regulatory-like domain